MLDRRPAAARKAGMQCVLILSRDEYQAFQGNLLTVYLMGAQVHLVEASHHWDLEPYVHEVCQELVGTKEETLCHPSQRHYSSELSWIYSLWS